MICCSCDFLTKEVFQEAAKDRAEEIRDAGTLGQAAGIVFHATHPERLGFDGQPKRRCSLCIGHIRETIVEMGLRPKEELEKTKHLSHKADCEECPNANACARFDFLALTPI